MELISQKRVCILNSQHSFMFDFDCKLVQEIISSKTYVDY